MMGWIVLNSDWWFEIACRPLLVDLQRKKKKNAEQELTELVERAIVLQLFYVIFNRSNQITKE